MDLRPLCDYWGFWRTDDLHNQNEYVFSLPSHSVLLPFSHLLHCLPYSSFLTELPEYQIIAKSSANINRFLCLQWNYANFHQLKEWFSFLSPDLFYNPISYLQRIPQLIFFLSWRKTLLYWGHNFPVVLLQWLQGNSKNHDYVMLEHTLRSYGMSPSLSECWLICQSFNEMADEKVRKEIILYFKDFFILCF